MDDPSCNAGPAGSNDPQTFAYGFAKAGQTLVSSGKLTDCDELAAFADIIATAFGNDTSKTAQEFGVFISQKDQSVQLAQKYGISIAANSNPVVLLTSDAGAKYGSGFQGMYQEGLYPLNIDQVHHFAAFFQVGFLTGSATAGSALAFYHDISNNGQGANPGDMALGSAASRIGAQFALGLLSPKQLGSSIKSLCK